MAIACLAAYGIALLLGLLASFFAVSALRVSDDYRHISEADVFDPDWQARDADAACTSPEIKSDNEKAVALYQRYMASAYWRIWQQHYRVHERKASRIRHGQNFLVGFLVMLMLIAGTLAYTATKVYVASGKASAPIRRALHEQPRSSDSSAANAAAAVARTAPSTSTAVATDRWCQNREGRQAHKDRRGPVMSTNDRPAPSAPVPPVAPGPTPTPRLPPQPRSLPSDGQSRQDAGDVPPTRVPPPRRSLPTDGDHYKVAT